MVTLRRLTLAVLLVLLALLAYWLRPLFHPYVISLWRDPLGILLLSLALVPLTMAAVNYAKMKLAGTKRGPRKISDFRWWMPLVLGCSLVVAAFIYMGISSDVRLAKAYKTYAFTETTSLPENEQNRLVPLAVAERFGADALQSSTERAYTWNPQLWDGKFSWVAPLTPNSDVRRLLDKAAGLQVVDATTTDRKASVVHQTLALSEGVEITDNIRWQLYKRDYLIEVPEIFYGKVDGRIVAIAPIMSYKGVLIRYPVVTGAFIVSAEGQIQKLTLEEAKHHPAVISAGRLYPEAYVRFMHESYALKHGVINKWFRHVDQTELSDPAGENNVQPYMLATKTGLTWLSAADPWGKSFGIYKVFMTNAISGETSIYSIDRDAALTGAAQAVGYVKSTKPQYNWQTETSEDGANSGNILAIEPRPVFVKNMLYWMVSITTNEAKGINETCFINAKDNKVTCFGDEKQMVAFIAGGPVEPKPAEQAQPSRQQKIEKLEQTLQQAMKELEELKAAK